MDPLACLNRLQDAFDRRDVAGRRIKPDVGEALSALVDYYQWRIKGGFEPPAFQLRVFSTGVNQVRGDVAADRIAQTLIDEISE